jgi:cellulose synthase/poly-beta-1,6-N-acetylglucosamine synthase-like glycosyltransferase
MKLSVVIPVLNQFDITNQSLKYIVQNDNYETIVIDNGSDEEFASKTEVDGITVIRYEDPMGSYPVFHEALQYTDADIIAYFHNDFFVYDKDWWKKVIAEFERDPMLGMIGFVSSTEVDSVGGRGAGTVSNFQGRSTIGSGIKNWKGTTAEENGERYTGFKYIATSDGCAMIFKREVLEKIPFRNDIAIHHFYDKIMSMEVIERGYKNGFLGIECDHISGRTCNIEPKYHEASRKWMTDRNITPSVIGINWDNENYKHNERIFLDEYRSKNMIPMKVDDRTGERII